MRKEVVIAVLIGVTLGLVMTYGIYVASSSLNSDSNVAASPAASPITQVIDTNLALSSPNDESLVSEPDLTVAGTTKPRSFVVISLHDTDITTTADETGHFSVSVKLTPGGNVIVVTAVDENGQNSTLERSVVLAVNEFLAIDESTSSAKVSPTPTAKPKTATSSSQTKTSN